MEEDNQNNNAAFLPVQSQSLFSKNGFLRRRDINQPTNNPHSQSTNRGTELESTYNPRPMGPANHNDGLYSANNQRNLNQKSTGDVDIRDKFKNKIKKLNRP